MLVSFTINKKPKLRLPKEFVYIPAGSYTRPADSMVVSTAGFYMNKYEVSNLQYRNFLNEVIPGLNESQKQAISCDSTGWSDLATYAEPLRKFYFRHSSFNQYPVVNISYEGALSYCKWLEEKLQKENPGYQIIVQIPGKDQWIWAAMGGRINAIYPWGNFYLRNRQGEYLCNFKRVMEHTIHRNAVSGRPEIATPETESSIYTSSINSFRPNDYGLFNMCGNAAEMVTEKGIAMGGSWNDYGGDVHIRSESRFAKRAATVGFRPVVIVKQK
jgi:formylglycine-generating enzyme required for sulfatase activity